MSRKFTILLMTVLLVPALLAGCGGKEEPEQGPIKRAPKPPPPKAEAPKPVEEVRKPLQTLGPKQRNPFRSHLIVLQKEVNTTRIRGPLECCELDQFRIKAVVVSPERSYALVNAPDGKSYIVKRGDIMGFREGKVIDINSQGLVVREYTMNPEGEILSHNDVKLLLPKKGMKR